MSERRQVSILTADAVFGRLLLLELESRGLNVSLSERSEEETRAAVAIVDLDSAAIPPEGSYNYLIGFSRLPALSADADARRCSMILRRPFRMSLLRREVFSRLDLPIAEHSEIPRALPSEETDPPTELTAFGLSCGTRSATLTPTERRLFRSLADANGDAVARSELERIAGDKSKGNLEVHLCAVRKKLREIGSDVTVESVRRVGYRLISVGKSGKPLDIISREWYNKDSSDSKT